MNKKLSKKKRFSWRRVGLLLLFVLLLPFTIAAWINDRVYGWRR